MGEGGARLSERPLAGALVSGGRKGLARDQPFDSLPERAFEDLLVPFGPAFMPGVLVSDPEAIRRVLVEAPADYPKMRIDDAFFSAIFGEGLLSLTGEDWRRHRRIMAPAFDPRSVQAYGPAITQAIARFRARWAALPDEAPVAIEAEMNALALDIIAGAVFATDSEAVKDEVGLSLKAGVGEALSANLLDIVPGLAEVRMSRRRRRMRAASAGLDAMLARLIEERAAGAARAGPEDLLTRLVRAREEGGGLSTSEVRDEVVTIFMAGHETTATTLMWIWYVLAERPAAARRLHEELDATLQGRAAETADLPRLPFTRRLVEEAMRLYPAAPGISGRRAARDDVLAGRRVRRGTLINIVPWVIHRHRALWDDPETFDPDRFLPERAEGRPRFAYLPFGAGPRVCIGQRLAMDETMLILASLAQDVDPWREGGEPPRLKAVITLKARGGMEMRLRKRRPRCAAPGP